MQITIVIGDPGDPREAGVNIDGELHDDLTALHHPDERAKEAGNIARLINRGDFLVVQYNPDAHKGGSYDEWATNEGGL